MSSPGPEAGGPEPPESTEERDAAAFARDRPPPGFRIYWSTSPFSGQHGPYYQRFEADRAIRGFRAAHKHCNSAGILHGGMLVSFVDALMGLAVWRRVRAMPLTMRLTTDFVSIARPGDWVEGVAWVTEVSDGIVFVRGEVGAGQRTVMTAHGLFATMARHAGVPR
jgi:acyl-coenzyme A thioesterase PaaI-like protein